MDKKQNSPTKAPFANTKNQQPQQKPNQAQSNKNQPAKKSNW